VFALIAQLLLMLLVILAAAELFTNALEHLGHRLGISEGVTGSLFAAVATALPETTVPLLALLGGTASARVNAEIGTGAILGAPLMLCTLSSFLMATAVLGRRGLRGRIQPENSGLVRDLNFFIGAFALAIAAMFVPVDWRTVRTGIGLVLALAYFLYVLLTLQASAALVQEGHGTQAEAPLWLEHLRLPRSLPTIFAQLGLATVLLLLGARGFINGVDAVSQALGVSALLIALLVIPLATELPEKLNSILWIRRGKDTLAMGNITGALVFQGTLLPAIGICLTDWGPRPEVLAGLLITLLAAAWLRAWARPGGIALWALGVNGALYLLYLGLMLG